MIKTNMMIQDSTLNYMIKRRSDRKCDGYSHHASAIVEDYRMSFEKHSCIRGKSL